MSYLCIDIGNVLCDCKFEEFFKHFAIKGHLQPHVWEFLETVQPLQDLGIINLEREIKKHFNLTEAHYIMEEWRAVLKANENSMKHLKSILDAGVNVALLSNMGPDHHRLLSNLFGGLYERCVQFISCDVGARKPSRIYYQSFLMDNPNFRGAVYVDDRMENLGAANRMGFNSQHLDTTTMSPAVIEDRWAEIKRQINSEIDWSKF